MKSKKLVLGTISALIVLLLGSCLDKYDEDFEIAVDAYFINKLIDGEPHTGTVYYVYGNQNMGSGTVTVPNDGGMEVLEKNTDNSFLLFKVPDDSEYSPDSPEEGVYFFEVTSSKDEYITDSDEQTFLNLDAAEIDQLTFDNTGLTVAWNEISECSGYVVKMFDASGALIYDGYSIAPNETEFYITEYNNTGIWEEEPVQNEVYTLSLQTYLFDSDADSYNYSYNIQEISIRDTLITWELF